MDTRLALLGLWPAAKRRQIPTRTGQNVKYRVLIEQDEDGIFVAEVPSLPGCVSQGRTSGEAIENVKEAIKLV